MLVLNAGSSSIKIALFGDDSQMGAVTEIGPNARLRLGAVDQVMNLPDHAAALAALLAALDRPLADLGACAHRVVHGGAELTETCRITPQVLDQIRAAIPLAPLHNPANLAGIMAVQALAPDLPQYACFDTAFHATNPELATTYALPLAERAQGLRRYGFHGISYAGMVAKLQEMTGNHLPKRLLGLHLGNGASLCAILDGCSVATTMGYSPLDGLTMGSRAGSLDPAVVLNLARRHGIDGAEAMLNRQSGLLALGGSNDMRALSNSPDGAFARAHFAYWAIRHAGSMIAAMGGLDAIAFTGGIGENDADIRAQIIAGLAFVQSPIATFIIPAEEERTIATSARKLFQGGV